MAKFNDIHDVLINKCGLSLKKISGSWNLCTRFVQDIPGLIWYIPWQK